MKKYIKMNDNDNYLSLGNLFRIIKMLSINSNNSVQTEIFCLIFEIENINSTTVNNYCVGSRSIGNIYKQKYLNYQKKYSKNKLVFVDIFLNIISIMDGKHHYIINDKLSFINQSDSFIKLVKNLYNIMKNDKNIKSELSDEITSNFNNKDYYNAFALMLMYLILDNHQPLFLKEQIENTINDLLIKTNISINDIKDILEIELWEGLSYHRSLLLLANKNNPYALYKLARMEYLGEINGKKNINKCLEYLNSAISLNHPASLWMMAYLILNKEISDDVDYKLAISYLNKAYEMGSLASCNTLGLCYLKGWNKEGKIDEKKALTYFLEAANKGYVYSLNNLGKYYEDKDFEKSFNYYLESANLNESWACNKVFRILYEKRKVMESFNYLEKAILSSLNEVCPYAYYNIVKYFYLNGNNELNIVKNMDLSIEYLEKCQNLYPAKKLLFSCLIKKYLYEKNLLLKKKILSLKEDIELSFEYNLDEKKEIEEELLRIKETPSISLKID